MKNWLYGLAGAVLAAVVGSGFTLGYQSNLEVQRTLGSLTSSIEGQTDLLKDLKSDMYRGLSEQRERHNIDIGRLERKFLTK